MKTRQIWVLARSVFFESLRNNSFFFLCLAGIALLFGAIPLSNMAVGDGTRVFMTYGFWVIGFWGLVLSLFFGVNIIKQELMSKTIYLLLTRPVERYVFVLGKFLGILGLTTGLFGILSVVFAAQLYLVGLDLEGTFYVALAGIYCEWVLLAVFSIFFAGLTSPVLHIFFLTGLYFMGHWSKYLYIYSQNLDASVIKTLLIYLYWLIPNLELLNFRQAALYGDSLDSAVIFKCCGVFLLWFFAVLTLAVAAFNRKRIN